MARNQKQRDIAEISLSTQAGKGEGVTCTHMSLKGGGHICTHVKFLNYNREFAESLQHMNKSIDLLYQRVYITI